MSVEGRGHILELPMWHIGLRAVQVVLSIIILGLAASLGGGFGLADAAALAIATVSCPKPTTNVGFSDANTLSGRIHLDHCCI